MIYDVRFTIYEVRFTRYGLRGRAPCSLLSALCSLQQPSQVHGFNLGGDGFDLLLLVFGPDEEHIALVDDDEVVQIFDHHEFVFGRPDQGVVDVEAQVPRSDQPKAVGMVYTLSAFSKIA